MDINWEAGAAFAVVDLGMIIFEETLGESMRLLAVPSSCGDGLRFNGSSRFCSTAFFCMLTGCLGWIYKAFILACISLFYLSRLNGP